MRRPRRPAIAAAGEGALDLFGIDSMVTMSGAAPSFDARSFDGRLAAPQPGVRVGAAGPARSDVAGHGTPHPLRGRQRAGVRNASTARRVCSS
jgi:hypothetical protein